MSVPLGKFPRLQCHRCGERARDPRCPLSNRELRAGRRFPDSRGAAGGLPAWGSPTWHPTVRQTDESGGAGGSLHGPLGPGPPAAGARPGAPGGDRMQLWTPHKPGASLVRWRGRGMHQDGLSLGTCPMGKCPLTRTTNRNSPRPAGAHNLAVHCPHLPHAQPDARIRDDSSPSPRQGTHVKHAESHIPQTCLRSIAYMLPPDNPPPSPLPPPLNRPNIRPKPP